MFRIKKRNLEKRLEKRLTSILWNEWWITSHFLSLRKRFLQKYNHLKTDLKSFIIDTASVTWRIRFSSYLCVMNIDLISLFSSFGKFTPLRPLGNFVVSTFVALFTSNHRHTFQSLTSPTADQYTPYYLPFTGASSDTCQKIIRKMLLPQWISSHIRFLLYHTSNSLIYAICPN